MYQTFLDYSPPSPEIKASSFKFFLCLPCWKRARAKTFRERALLSKATKIVYLDQHQIFKDALRPLPLSKILKISTLKSEFWYNHDIINMIWNLQWKFDLNRSKFWNNVAITEEVRVWYDCFSGITSYVIWYICSFWRSM